MFRTTTRERRPATFKPFLEPLEERQLLSGMNEPTSNGQLALDSNQLAVATFRLIVDGAVFADEVAAAAGAEMPPATAAGIAALAGLAPYMHSPAMVYDFTNLLNDVNTGNVVGALSDAAGLFDDTAIALTGDIIAFQQASAAIAHDILGTSQVPSLPPTQSPPQPSVTSFGNFPAGSYTVTTDGHMGGLAAQNVVANGTTLSGQLNITQFEVTLNNNIIGTADGGGVINGSLQSDGVATGTFSFNIDTSAFQNQGLPAVTQVTVNFQGTLNQDQFTGTLTSQGVQFGNFDMAK